MCLAIGFIAVIGGLQSAAAEDEPAKAANSAARCQALTGLNLGRSGDHQRQAGPGGAGRNRTVQSCYQEHDSGGHA